MWPLYIVFAMIIVGIIAMIIASHHKAFKLTSETQGEVIESTERERLFEGAKRYETEIRLPRGEKSGRFRISSRANEPAISPPGKGCSCITIRPNPK